jgi:hypothetical protein
MPCEAAEEFGIFGQAAHVNLKEGKAILDRGELLKELFLGELLFQGAAFVFVVSVDKTFHDGAPVLGWVVYLSTSIASRRTVLAHYRRSEAADCVQPAPRPSNLAITRRPKPV